MAKNYSDASCEIEVDSCYTCGAVFLDCDELFRIREQFDNESERVDDFNKKFMAAYAQDILKAKEEADKAAQSRSLLRKLFLSGYEKYRDLSR